MELKKQFIQRSEQVKNPRVLSVVVSLPSGALEVITNTEQLESKIEYYNTKYDADFCLAANKSIRIISFMLV